MGAFGDGAESSTNQKIKVQGFLKEKVENFPPIYKNEIFIKDSLYAHEKQKTKDGLEPKRIRFVHPYQEKESNIFLLEAVKGGKSRMVIEPPLVVYKAPNQYTDEIYKIYGMEREEM